MDKTEELFKELTEAAGVPGYEIEVRAVLRKHLESVAEIMQDRIGSLIAVQAMQLLKEQGHPNTLYGVGTVQEEVGLRGAKTSAEVVGPDVA